MGIDGLTRAARANIHICGLEYCYQPLIMHGEAEPQLSDTPGL